jgi:glycosyltransferase involved in cell wall biosynthesis
MSLLSNTEHGLLSTQWKPFDLEKRYEAAIRFFKERSPVVFVSQHYRFWETHGFVQQVLAKLLVEAGIDVHWLDGAHWKKIEPVQAWNSPLLHISQLPSLPLRRVPLIDAVNPGLQVLALKRKLKLGAKPFLWVQSGLDERVVERLPYIDVFSVFDDPYLHSPSNFLSTKAKVIVTQNKFAGEIYAKLFCDKTIVLLPPVEMSPKYFEDNSEIKFPDGFPDKVMGYIGSFFPEGFDLVLFEDFIRSLPDWGFVLCGRTDGRGLKKIRTFAKYKNFFYLPWVPRNQVGAVWKQIDLNLMLYRPASASDGAFPVKFLEALYYKVPSLTTRVAKTSSLEGVIPRFLFPEQLKAEAVSLANSSRQPIEKLYQQFSCEMDPKSHLIRVAEKYQSQPK